MARTYLGWDLLPLQSADTRTGGDVGGGVGLRCERRGGREGEGRGSGDRAAGASQTGADADHRGGRTSDGVTFVGLLRVVVAMLRDQSRSRAARGPGASGQAPGL